MTRLNLADHLVSHHFGSMKTFISESEGRNTGNYRSLFFLAQMSHEVLSPLSVGSSFTLQFEVKVLQRF